MRREEDVAPLHRNYRTRIGSKVLGLQTIIHMYEYFTKRSNKLLNRAAIFQSHLNGSDEVESKVEHEIRGMSAEVEQSKVEAEANYTV